MRELLDNNPLLDYGRQGCGPLETNGNARRHWHSEIIINGGTFDKVEIVTLSSHHHKEYFSVTYVDFLRIIIPTRHPGGQTLRWEQNLRALKSTNL